MPIYVLSEGQNTEETVLPITTEMLLHHLGVSRKLRGFRYVEFMVRLIMENPDAPQMMTKWLYPETAQHYGVSPCSVERAVRGLVRSCWDKREYTRMEFFAGRNLQRPPTNLEFLDIIVSCLRREAQRRNA